MSRSWLSFLATVVALAPLCADDPVISEFMASNQNSIRDDDGDRSDWIELRNPGAEPVDLGGWFLTDSAANKSKWTFPAVTLPGGGYLLVWASSKDRRDPAAPLHTNFNLSAGGEYLALIRPDGQTAAAEFAPAYPPQFPDISYGTSTTVNEITLVDKATAARVFVPDSNALGTTWRASSFNDTSWLTGTFAVGFMNNANPNLQSDLGADLIALGTGIVGTGRSAYARARFTIVNPAAVASLTLRVNYDDGFHAWINGANIAKSPNAPNEGALTYNSTAGNHGPGAFETFDVSSRIGSLVAGENVLALQVLNTNATSSDLFLWPQLIAAVDSGGAGQTGYFSLATPGTANGGTNTLQLPQTVTLSRGPGTFVNAFELALSGANAGQEIRYVVSSPTSAGATLAAPTAASTLYTAPIPINSSTLLRAAIFDPANGQKSRITTAQFLLLETMGGTGNTNFNTAAFTSNLPILVADDHGDGTPNDSGSGTYTTGLLHVYDTVNGTATLQGPATDFTRIGLRIRGSSSAGFDKKSYGMETWDEFDNDADRSLLGLPADSDWVLNGPWHFDDTFIHNAFIFDVSRQVGRWAPRTRFVEMFSNFNGGKLNYADYAGVYVLTEKIKSTGDRVAITGIQPGDTEGDAVTGGYIFKIDRPDSDEVRWRTANGVPNPESGQSLVIVEPDPQRDAPEQITYLQNYVRDFDATLFSEATANFTTRNYRNYIDTPAWIDHHILNALAYNVDALRLSAFYFKDRGKKIEAGPIWDFDRALGSDDGRDSNPSSWSNIGYFFDRDWWGRLFRDPDFVQAWVDRWVELRRGPLAQANLAALADRMGAEIGNAAGARDAAKWPANAASGGVYLNEITAMKSWLNTRMNWINNQMPAPPTAGQESGIVDSGSTVTLGGSGTIRYTLDGSDPRPPGGGVPGTNQTYAGPLALTQTVVLTARRQLANMTTVFSGQAAIGTRWSAPVRRVYLVDEAFAAAGDVVVSEINYHPLEPTAAERAALPGVTGSDFEYLELRNIGERTVNLFEVTFIANTPFQELRLEPFTLAPGEHALVVKNRAAFVVRYGEAPASRIASEWTEGSLDNAGETIQIVARDGSPIQTFTYDDEGAWPGRSDGKGSALEYRGTTFADADFNNPQHWRSSSELHGSPGVAGAGPDNRVVINEILSHTAPPYVDTIELRNLTGDSLDLGGWYLSHVITPETADSYKLFRIPAGTILPAQGHLAFNETQFNPDGGFAFNGPHDNEAWLLSANGEGSLRFADHVEFGPARLNEPWGRWPDGTGPLWPLAIHTNVDETSEASPRPPLGAPNSEPRVGPVVLNEIHHSPAGGNADLPFIELWNPTEAPQPLERWRLRGQVDFDFTTEVLPAGGLLVIVPFAPTDEARVTAFRTAYDLTAEVALAGPWSVPDRLEPAGEVVLYRAETPPPAEPGYFPLTVEDTVDYLSAEPWPVTTDGLSLNRRTPAGVGVLPASWEAKAPTPGALEEAPPLPDPVFADWQAEHFPEGGDGSGPEDDPDGDGVANLFEYAYEGNPHALDPSPPPPPTLALATDPERLVFTFTRSLARPDVLWTVETSSDLEAWESLEDTVISTTETTELRQATVPATPEPHYFRLRLTVAP